jgi:hypothetical protein
MYVMALVYPKSHLCIMEYNRLIKNTNGLNDNEILERVNQTFNLFSCQNFSLWDSWLLRIPDCLKKDMTSISTLENNGTVWPLSKN